LLDDVGIFDDADSDQVDQDLVDDLINIDASKNLWDMIVINEDANICSIIDIDLLLVIDSYVDHNS
jgi:hypothetical protein